MLLSKLKETLVQGWNSPTLMTWGSFFSRSLSLVVVLPLLLTRLTTAEISLWYILMTVIGLQTLVDIGFSPTFIRVISYAMGGAAVQDLKSPRRENTGQPNWDTIATIYGSMRRIYLFLGILWTSLLAIGGTLALLKPVSAVEDRGSAWIAWGVVLAVSNITVRSNIYSSYLQGTNRVALLRRWETLTSLGGIATSFLVLILGGGLLGLVIAHQGWQTINILRNIWLARIIENGKQRTFANVPFNREVFAAVWPSAWRSGVGVLMSYGLIQASGIFYAQIGATASVASYLLGLRLFQTVSQFSQAPFYSKIPLYSRLYAEGRRDELVRLAQRGMRFSHWTYVAGFVGLGLFGAPLLKIIGSNVTFPDSLLWSLLGLAFFVERYGAMHIQLYSTTNHIIWHIANGVTGTIYIIVSILLFNYFGVYAFPLGILAGYLGFYAWYSASHAYRAFNLGFFSFEKSASILPLVVVLLYVALNETLIKALW